VNDDAGGKPEIILAPEELKEEQAQRSINLPCMGFSFLIGLTMLPMVKKKRRKLTFV